MIDQYVELIGKLVLPIVLLMLGIWAKKLRPIMKSALVLTRGLLKSVLKFMNQLVTS